MPLTVALNRIRYEAFLIDCGLRIRTKPDTLIVMPRLWEAL
jgi:hypothetical protein